MWNKYSFILLLCYLCIVPLRAEHYKSAIDHPAHYLSLSLYGGEGNTLTYYDDGLRSGHIKNMAGGNANFTFAYEINSKNVFFNIGLTAEYYYTRQNIKDTVTDIFDYNKDQFMYRYSSMSEYQRHLAAGLPIQIGYIFPHNVYVAVGAKFMLNLMHSAELSTNMYTIWDATASGAEMPFDGSKSQETIGIEGTAGVCPPQDYQSKSNNVISDIDLAITGEIGYQIPLPDKIKGVKMRIGAYAEYSMPMPKYELDNRFTYADYQKLGKDYSSQTSSIIKEKLEIPSILENSMFLSYSHRMAVGLKFTVLFDVTHYVAPCHCSANRLNARPLQTKKMGSYKKQSRIR